jgi:hypothetical protein
MLPDNFPIYDHKTGLRYSDALFVVLHGQFRSKWEPSRCMIEPVSQGNIRDALGGRVAHGVSSVFSRLNFTEDDGTPIVINSHSFRHWLNTMAQRGGMSQIEIAKWSGRKDVRQNRGYDHMSAEEVIEIVRDSIGQDERMFGPLAEFKPNAPVTREAFKALQAPTAHTTDLGFCLHDFAAMPCQLHRDCLNCAEHVCIKGDRKRTEQIRHRYDEALVQLEKADRAVQERVFGSNRWQAHAVATVERIEQLLAILDDPMVPEGAVIQMAARGFTSPILVRREAVLIEEDPTFPVLSNDQTTSDDIDFDELAGIMDAMEDIDGEAEDRA